VGQDYPAGHDWKSLKRHGFMARDIFLGKMNSLRDRGHVYEFVRMSARGVKSFVGS